MYTGPFISRSSLRTTQIRTRKTRTGTFRTRKIDMLEQDNNRIEKEISEISQEYCRLQQQLRDWGKRSSLALGPLTGQR